MHGTEVLLVLRRNTIERLRCKLENVLQLVIKKQEGWVNTAYI
jgi:hypothetical protein